MQIRAIHKSKHFFYYLVKYLVPILALGTILFQLTSLETRHSTVFYDLVDMPAGKSLLLGLIILGFTTINWIIEAYKWQLSVRAIAPITILKALQQCLVGAATSIFTPAKLGDYAAKPLFYSPENRPKIIWLNTLNHMLQMLNTALFGLASLGILLAHFPQVSSVINSSTLVFFLLILLSITLIVLPVLHLKYQKLYKKLKVTLAVASTQLCLKLFALSMLRFLVFSAQFIALLYIFGNPLHLGWTFIISSAIYILNSMLPTPAMADGIVKSSLGVFLFGLFSMSPWIVLCATLLMWVANHVLPASLGSWLLLRLKPAP